MTDLDLSLRIAWALERMMKLARTLGAQEGDLEEARRLLERRETEIRRPGMGCGQGRRLGRAGGQEPLSRGRAGALGLGPRLPGGLGG